MHHRRIPLGLIIAIIFGGTSVGIFIAWIFRTTSNDYMQHDSDAAYFFETATTGNSEFKLDVSLVEEENSLPIMLWSSIYRVISHLGQPDPFGGIVLNALLVVCSQLIVIVFARRIFYFSSKQLVFFALLLASNGLLMMFAGIHIRDAFLLVTTTISIVLFRPRADSIVVSRVWRFVALISLMFIAFLCRKEGFIVPLMVYLIALSMKLTGRGSLWKILFVGLALVFTVAVVGSGVIDLAIDNYTAYKLLSQAESKDSSLAYYLLYELPFPVSTIASAVLLLFIKIPFWRGMFFDSYSFFISLAAIQMLFIIPAIIPIVWRSIFHNVGSDVLYLVLVLLGLLFIVAITSNQVRHFAIGYPFLILLYQYRQQVLGTRGLYVLAQYFIFSVAVFVTIVVEFR
jgi:hypothetical protein